MENGKEPESPTGKETIDDVQFQPQWEDIKPVHWFSIVAVLVLLIGYFMCSCNTSGCLQTVSDQECGVPVKMIRPWHVRTFRPNWFGLVGGPAPITYRTKGKKASRVLVVDLDKRDIEIRMWVDDRDYGYREVQRDDNVNCGGDVVKCLHMGLASGLVVVPPGKHTVKAEIVKRNGTFKWGSERSRRVMWMVEECA